MQIQTLIYNNLENAAWSAPFPELDSEQTLVLVFAAPKYSHNKQPLSELAKHFKKSKIIGCSSAGEILGPQIFDNSLSVAIIKFENTEIQVVKYTIDSAEDSFIAGKYLASNLNKKDLRGIFIISDGLSVNGSELVKGLNKHVPPDVVITGGLAADGKDFKKTWVLHNDEVLSQNILAVGFYSKSLRIGHASRGGWDVFGPERLVTHSKNNVLYELDSQPALVLYKNYLGEKASGLPATGLLYPLGIHNNSGDRNMLVRTILAVDEATQSMTFAGDIPQGSQARLMRSNFEHLINSSSEAASAAYDMILNGDPSLQNQILTIAVSCVGRRLVMGTRTEDETEAMYQLFPPSAVQIGFYSYGELSPSVAGSCSLHNQTMTVTILYE